MGEGKRLILTSYGLNTRLGRRLIGEELQKDAPLQEKRILLFYEPYFSIEDRLVEACLEMGFCRENILLPGRCKTGGDKPGAGDLPVDYVYVTEGNTFEIAALLREQGWNVLIREAFAEGASYIGASAGALLAGSSIEEAYAVDRNEVRLRDFRGLGLFDGVVIPHCTPEQLQERIAEDPQMEQKYHRICSVENEGILVLRVPSGD